MQRILFANVQLRTQRFKGYPRIIRRVLFALFLVQFAFVWARLWLPGAPLPKACWPDGLLLVLASASVVAWLARDLPAQNVMPVSVLISVIAGAVHTLGALTGIPFGPYTYNEPIGQQLFNPLPWAVPAIWLVSIPTARGVARLAMRPWRKAKAYGYWLMGVTVGLMVLFDLALEPYATTVKHYWSWSPTRIPWDWYGAPVVDFLGWALTALLILVVVTPWLIRKKPVKLPPDYQPLIVWLLLNLLFVTGAIVDQQRAAVALTGTGCAVVTVFALRGAKK